MTEQDPLKARWKATAELLGLPPEAEAEPPPPSPKPAQPSPSPREQVPERSPEEPPPSSDLPPSRGRRRRTVPDQVEPEPVPETGLLGARREEDAELLSANRRGIHRGGLTHVSERLRFQASGHEAACIAL